MRVQGSGWVGGWVSGEAAGEEGSVCMIMGGLRWVCQPGSLQVQCQGTSKAVMPALASHRHRHPPILSYPNHH
jgi:hypothetical protein